MPRRSAVAVQEDGVVEIEDQPRRHPAQPPGRQRREGPAQHDYHVGLARGTQDLADTGSDADVPWQPASLPGLGHQQSRWDNFLLNQVGASIPPEIYCKSLVSCDGSVVVLM